jgi:ABC-type branched-subunit amino acid transport system substrate-binding protein
MKGFIQRIGVTVAIAAFVTLGAPAISPADTIRIGAILSLTGNNAAPGQYVHDGILLAVQEINKRGGVNGNKLEVTFADSGSDAQTTTSAFHKMEASLHPLLYVSYSSNVGTALAPLAETNHVVLVGLVTAAIDFTIGREWVFRYWPLGPGYITPLLRVLQSLRVRQLGIIYQNDEFGTEQQALMTKGFSEAGGSVLVQSFELKDTDYRRQISALKQQQAIYIAGSGAQLLNVTRQLREANFKGHILTPAGGADPALFGLPEMSGVYVAAPIIHNPSYLYAREAGEQFLARYHKPFNQWAANGYDFIKLICGLLEDRDISRQGVRDVMAGGFEYSGVFGHVRLRSGEHDLTFPMYPAQILNGTLQYR